MFTFYLACLIFGGILLGFSLFFGGEHDGDADFHGDAHIDIDDHELPDAEVESHIGDIHTDAVQFFSFRNIIYFLTFFGLTGLILNFMNFNFIISLLSAIGMGSFAWFFGYKLMKYLKLSASGETFDISALKGIKGKIIMETNKGRKGKVMVEYRGSNYELTAEISENSDDLQFKFGEEVLVIDMQNNIAIVEKYDL